MVGYVMMKFVGWNELRLGWMRYYATRSDNPCSLDEHCVRVNEEVLRFIHRDTRHNRRTLHCAAPIMRHPISSKISGKGKERRRDRRRRHIHLFVKQMVLCMEWSKRRMWIVVSTAPALLQLQSQTHLPGKSKVIITTQSHQQSKRNSEQ